MTVGSGLLLKQVTFAAFDVETTGLDPVRDRVVEIGVVVFAGNEIKKTIELLVNPGILIPKALTDFHGISDEMVKDQPKMAEILPSIFSLLSETIPLAHNASFDVSFLVESAKRENLSFMASQIVDTCELARKLFPRLPNHKLQSLVRQFNLMGDQSHRALSDAKSCFSLFCHSIQELPLKWETPWQDFCSSFSGSINNETVFAKKNQNRSR